MDDRQPPITGGYAWYQFESGGSPASNRKLLQSRIARTPNTIWYRLTTIFYEAWLHACHRCREQRTGPTTVLQIPHTVWWQWRCKMSSRRGTPSTASNVRICAASGHTTRTVLPLQNEVTTQRERSCSYKARCRLESWQLSHSNSRSNSDRALPCL